MALTVMISYQTDSTGFASLRFPSIAANQTYDFPAVGGSVMAAAALPAAGLILYSDANGMPTSAATFAYASNLLTVGTQTPISAMANSRFQGVGADSTVVYSALDTFGTGVAPTFVGRTASGTKASPTATAQGAVLARLAGMGYNDAANYTGVIGYAQIMAMQAHTTANQGTYFSLWLTPNNSTTPAATLTQYGGGATYFPGTLGTTASAANVFLNTGSTPANQLLIVSSSMVHKTEVEDMDPEVAQRLVYETHKMYFRSLCEADQVIAPGTKDGRMSFYGFPAEQVADIDPRMAQWTYRKEDMEPVETWEPEETLVQVDADGNPGEPVVVTPAKLISRDWVPVEGARERMIPCGVGYERFVVPLSIVAVLHRDRIEELWKQNADQAAQIAELQAAVAKLLGSR